MSKPRATDVRRHSWSHNKKKHTQTKTYRTVQPTIESTGEFFSTKSFSHPTLITMRFILFEISPYCSCLLPAVSQCILSNVPDL